MGVARAFERNHMRPHVVFKRGLLCCALLAICILASSPRGLVVFVLLAVCAFYIQRVLWRKNQRSGGNRFGFFPTYTSAGNAFQWLQMLAEPQTGYVIDAVFHFAAGAVELFVKCLVGPLLRSQRSDHDLGNHPKPAIDNHFKTGQ